MVTNEQIINAITSRILACDKEYHACGDYGCEYAAYELRKILDFVSTGILEVAEWDI